MGCYYFPSFSSSSISIPALRAPDSETILRNMSTEADLLKSCGDYARQNKLTYFALSGNQCYCSANLTHFIRGGPSKSCERGCSTGNCLLVLQIAEQETFELSVRAVETCGADYCKQGGVICSGRVRTLRPSVAVAYLTLFITLMFFSGQ
jgi:hypothetical protein